MFDGYDGLDKRRHPEPSPFRKEIDVVAFGVGIALMACIVLQLHITVVVWYCYRLGLGLLLPVYYSPSILSPVSRSWFPRCRLASSHRLRCFRLSPLKGALPFQHLNSLLIELDTTSRLLFAVVGEMGGSIMRFGVELGVGNNPFTCSRLVLRGDAME